MTYKAFSLIELMVVIAIVAILAATAVPTYKLAIAKVKVSNSLTLLQNYANKAILYYNQTGQLPTASQLDPNSNGSWIISDGSFSGSPVTQTGLATAYSLSYIYYSTFNTGSSTPSFVFTTRMAPNSTGGTSS